MDSIKRINKFQRYDLKKSLGAFWTVMIIVNSLAYILALYFNSRVRIGISHNNLLSVAGSNMMAIFIFLIVYGIVMYHENFALALSFGVTRKDFYKSVIVDNFLMVIIFAIIQGILQFIDKYIVELLGSKPLVEFGLFNTATENILFVVLALFTFYLTILSITNLLGVLQYRFGYKFWIGFAITVITLQIIGNFFTKTIVGFSNMSLWLWSRWDNFAIFLLEFFIIIICYTLGYLLIKKANIKK